MPLAAEIEPPLTQAVDDVGRAGAALARDHPDRFIISLKPMIYDREPAVGANMHSPCGMLFKAVSNWPASAASRSRATTARMNILCKLAEIRTMATRNATHTTDIAM